MNFVEIVVIAVGLAMDAFAVSIAAAAAGKANSRRAVFRLSFHFGLFQFLMPVLGWFLGSRVAVYIEAVDHWVAFGLLAFVGVRMIRSGLDPDGESYNQNDPSRGFALITLSVATSIDAMAVGLSLAVLNVSIWYPSAVIGVVTSCLSVVGIRIGNRIGGAFGKRMEILGGALLILIGVKVLVEHLVP